MTANCADGAWTELPHRRNPPNGRHWLVYSAVMTESESQQAQQEIRHLRATVEELRKALEKKNFEIERQVQASRQAANERIKQLEDTVDRMRISLEEVHASRQAQIQAETRILKDQLQQAQETIIALRDQLEQAVAS